jgi:predicted DNA-binding protein (MmcQ/YjbR family)
VTSEPWPLYPAKMDANRLRAFLLTLPHAVETMQWGENLVYWIGDKAIGGKMFALINLDQPADCTRGTTGHGVVSYSAGPSRYAELLEVDGIVPAPYMARIHWVAATEWVVFRATEWERELRAAHSITLAKLPPGVRRILALPPVEYRRALAQRKRVLAGRAEVKKKAAG